MADTRTVQSLFVLTLLQLCRAQASDQSWYIANTITHDSPQPKTISEIFSTESPFSDTNPILVLPKSTSGPSTIASSTFPPSSFTRDYTRPFPSSFSSTPFPSTKPPQVEITQYTEQTQPPWQPTVDITSTINQQTTLRQVGSPFANTFLVPEDNVAQHRTTERHFLTSTTPATFPSSYAVYENKPIADGPRKQESESFENTDSELDFAHQPARKPSSTTPPKTTRVGGRSTTRSSTWPTRKPLNKESTTRKPSTVSAEPTHKPNIPHNSGYGTLPLKIRVVGPRGSVTNVNIGPKVVVTPSTTTKKPKATPPRRTPKPKRNTYEACLNGCKAKRGPICAIPLSAPWINPEQLKGFPSVCHMACFNSYKKESYEKVVDGRCGRLRTRIQSFDTGTKLKRDELNKSQYFIDNNHQTVVEVSPLKN